jgi:hypothetical protein
MSESYDLGGQSGAFRQNTAEAIEAYIVRLERERHNPEHYECAWLIRAIVWFGQGKYMESTRDVRRAQKPMILRTSQDYGDSWGHYETMATLELRRCWDETKGLLVQ